MKQQLNFERYQRQLILKGFGASAQHKLQEARVLVIGAGGLGCPIMQYLVAAGVGHIGIADHDTVSVSNLHRQILFGVDDVGQPKVEVIKRKMSFLNSDCDVRTWTRKWDAAMAVQYFAEYDVIVDATDNFASRYLINDACVLLQKPLVFGAVSQFEGQVAVFNHLLKDGSRSVNYRDLFPEPPAGGEVLNCAEAGVLGVLPGIIGSMQATEVIKLITGIGIPLANKLWNYNALTQDVFTIQLGVHSFAASKIPATVDSLIQTNYEWLCGVPGSSIVEIDVTAWLSENRKHTLVDVREPHEMPRLSKLCAERGVQLMEIPLSALEDQLESLVAENIVFVCQAGRRSLQAASLLLKQNPGSSVCSLKGGVQAMVASNFLTNE
jgi:molybdopterin/thiamine biosynthesis adenylyltransferase/rhodanese-related sulfurtransferase